MNRLEFIVVMIKLFLGAMQFITFKALSQTKVMNLEGKVVPFKRSFFVAFILFCSVMLAFIPYIYMKRKNPTEVSSITRRSLLRVALSGFCDACAQIFVIFGAANISPPRLAALAVPMAVRHPCPPTVGPRAACTKLSFVRPGKSLSCSLRAPSSKAPRQPASVAAHGHGP